MCSLQTLSHQLLAWHWYDAIPYIAYVKKKRFVVYVTSLKNEIM